MSKLKDIVKFIFILFLAGYISAESTGTVTELTPEQIDWNDINKLSADSIIALKLAKQNEKYNYLRDEINNRQAVLEIAEEKIIRNKRLGRGYFGHIYPCHKQNKIKEIESRDSLSIGDELIIDGDTYIVEHTTPAVDGSTSLATGATYYFEGSTYVIGKYDEAKGGWLTYVVGIIAVFISGLLVFLKKK